MWTREMHRLLKPQHIVMSLIYMHYFNKACPPRTPLSHYHNGFMATGALGLIYVRLQVVVFSNPKNTHVTTRATSMLNMEE